jgi:hypothetical protein
MRQFCAWAAAVLALAGGGAHAAAVELRDMVARVTVIPEARDTVKVEVVHENPRLPIKEPEFRQVLSPEYMVKTRVGIGGPQPAEVERMLAEARTTLQGDQNWMRQARQRIHDADTRLDQAFGQLVR